MKVWEGRGESKGLRIGPVHYPLTGSLAPLNVLRHKARENWGHRANHTSNAGSHGKAAYCTATMTFC